MAKTKTKFKLIGFLIIPIIWLGIVVDRMFKNMMKKLIPTSQILPDIATVLDGYTNCYYLKSVGGYIAIDSGERPEVTLAQLDELQIKPEEIKYVFLTHSDSDHAGAIEIFTEAEVFLSKQENEIVYGNISRTFSKFKIPLRNKVKHTYDLLEDGEIKTFLGRKIECILTPGHTPGSMSYLIDDKYLFTGDTISLSDGKADNFIKLFTMDLEANTLSIKRLAHLFKEQDIKYIFTAHHGYSDDFSHTFSEWQ